MHTKVAKVCASLWLVFVFLNYFCWLCVCVCTRAHVLVTILRNSKEDWLLN